MTLKSLLANAKSPVIMGVLNVTPDSFSDGGKYLNTSVAIDHALHLIDEGADMIDIGGESSRPGSLPISTEEERDRIFPVIHELRRHSSIYISVDTYKPEIMALAIDSGVNMINDIKAMTSQGALEILSKSKVDISLMHMQGSPTNMQISPKYESVTDEVIDFLNERVKHCEDAGISKDRIAIDPGFGFGKTFDDNAKLFKDIKRFVQLSLPVLIGVSRKSMIKKMVGENMDDIIDASALYAALAARNGADILRVHDVKKTKQMLDNLKV